MSTDALESRVLRNLENKQKTCYNCNKRGHTKYECRQSPFISNSIEKRHEPDIDNVVLIMEGLPRADKIDLNQFMKSLLESLKLSKDIKQGQYSLERPWSHICRRNDVKIVFKSTETKKLFLTTVNSQKVFYYPKEIFCYYGVYNDTGFKYTFEKKEYKLFFRDDLPHDLDRMYTKALELKDQYKLDCVMVGNQGKIVAHKRTYTFFWCKNEDDLERVKKSLDKQSTYQVTRKRKLLTIVPAGRFGQTKC